MDNLPEYKLRQIKYGKDVPHKPDEKFMYMALEEAKKAFEIGESPVGAVIVRRGEVISAAYNTRETERNALHHAEIKAIDSACKKLNGWRLWECELYVTLEPCIMCSGAIMQARIPNLYFGAFDEKGGCIKSCMDINLVKGLNHKIKYTGGILEGECSKLLKEFFQRQRSLSNSGGLLRQD